MDKKVGMTTGGKGGISGKSNADMKSMGRGLAKVAAQKKSSKIKKDM